MTPTICPLTTQQMLNRVWDHFVTQEQPLAYSVSTDQDGQTRHNCVYHNWRDGSRCAIGCLFTEEEAIRLPSDGVYDLIAYHGVEFPELDLKGFKPSLGCQDHPDAGFLHELQRIHDEAARLKIDYMPHDEQAPRRRECIRLNLITLAHDYDLTTPEDK